MTRRTDTIPATYFSEMYEGDADPWRFETSPYERGKYAATIASLPRERYASGLEIGCSIGVLTHALAARCDALLALDPAPVALKAARERNRDRPHVTFRLGSVPADYPDGRYDLVMLSEVAYYLARPDLERLADQVGASLRPGGTVVLVHWLGETDYPLTGDEAADLFCARIAPLAEPVTQTRNADYRLDVLAARSRA
jgi:SAM-dependent methyltransferase